MTNLAIIAMDVIYIIEAMIFEDYTSMGIHFGYMVTDSFKEPIFDEIEWKVTEFMKKSSFK